MAGTHMPGAGQLGSSAPPPLGTAPSLAFLVPGAAQEVAAVGWARGLRVRPLSYPGPHQLLNLGLKDQGQERKAAAT